METKLAAKHTPSPWHIEEIRGTQDKDNVYVAQAGGELVASVMAYGPHNPDRILRGRANAKLIAAAPDLLDELIRLREAALVMADPEHCLHATREFLPWKELAELARAAIAKATGKEV